MSSGARSGSGRSRSGQQGRKRAPAGWRPERQYAERLTPRFCVRRRRRAPSDGGRRGEPPLRGRTGAAGTWSLTEEPAPGLHNARLCKGRPRRGRPGRSRITRLYRTGRDASRVTVGGPRRGPLAHGLPRAGAPVSVAEGGPRRSLGRALLSRSGGRGGRGDDSKAIAAFPLWMEGQGVASDDVASAAARDGGSGGRSPAAARRPRRGVVPGWRATCRPPCTARDSSHGSWQLVRRILGLHRASRSAEPRAGVRRLVDRLAAWCRLTRV